MPFLNIPDVYKRQVRYSVVEQEIDNRSVNATDLCEGALRVILGLAKKVIIANNLWSIVNTFFGKDITGLSVLGTWYTIIAVSYTHLDVYKRQVLQGSHFRLL